MSTESEKGISIQEVKERASSLSKVYKISFSKNSLSSKISFILEQKTKHVKQQGFRNSSSNITVPYSLIERKYN